MHDIKWIRDNPDAFDPALARRGLPGEAKRLIALDERRRAAIQKAEAALARRNAASKEIGAAKKSNEEATAQKLLAEVAELKTAIPALEAEEKKLSQELDDALAQIPNLPLRRRGAGRQGRRGQCRAPSFRCQAQLRLCAQAAFRSGRGARPDGFRDRGEAFRRALRGPEERSRTAGACARAVHARCAHERARLYRGHSAAAGARRRDVRHSAIAEVCRGSVFRVCRSRRQAGHRLPEAGRSGRGNRSPEQSLAHPHRRSSR